MDKKTARLLIRKLLHSGRLPYGSASKVSSGPAAGEICDACGVRISDDQLVVKGLTSGSKRAGPIQFHVLCFDLWNDERCKPRDMTAPLRPGQETSMQVKCSKCLQLIAISDDIESSDGHLSHVECSRARRLTPEERHLLFVYCSDHLVAQCLSCGRSLLLVELGSDLLAGCTNLCPGCRKDLTENVRAHLYGCAMLPSEVRLRSRAAREAAQHLVKQSQELRDKADVRMREAEVALFEAQQALRAAMSQRTQG